MFVCNRWGFHLCVVGEFPTLPRELLARSLDPDDGRPTWRRSRLADGSAALDGAGPRALAAHWLAGAAHWLAGAVGQDVGALAGLLGGVDGRGRRGGRLGLPDVPVLRPGGDWLTCVERLLRIVGNALDEGHKSLLGRRRVNRHRDDLRLSTSTTSTTT